MLIRVGYEIAFESPEPAAMILMLYTHPLRSPTIRKPEHLQIEPFVPVSDFIDAYGNRCARVFVPAGRVVFRNDAVVTDSGLPDLRVPDASQQAVQDLPCEVLQYLLASRYCEVDSELKDVAWTLFGGSQPGWPRVQAICDFVHQHIRFDYMKSTASDTESAATSCIWQLPFVAIAIFRHVTARDTWEISASLPLPQIWILVHGSRPISADNGTHLMLETMSVELAEFLWRGVAMRQMWLSQRRSGPTR